MMRKDNTRIIKLFLIKGTEKLIYTNYYYAEYF